MHDKKRTLQIAAGVVRRGESFLIAQRHADDAYGLLWEFPGGCIEPGETPQQALKREMREELGIDVAVNEMIARYEDESKTLVIDVHLFACALVRGEPQPLDCRDLRWCTLAEMNGLDIAPADRTALRYLAGHSRELTPPHDSDTIESRKGVAMARTQKTVFIVDDDVATAENTKAFLESNGYRVTIVSDGELAAEAADRAQPDIILLDIIMPKIDGFTVAKQLRFNGGTKQIPIIICSAQTEMRDLFAIEGINDYLVKPVDTQALLEMIRKRIG